MGEAPGGVRDDKGHGGFRGDALTGERAPVHDLPAIAREMKDAQDLGQSAEPLTARLPGFDLAAAYQVADLVHRARLAEGARPLGRKLGFTNPDMGDRFGVREPIWAYVYDATVVQLHETHTTCRLAGFVEPRIEPEIILHFRRAPPVGGSLAEIAAAVDWVAHGFEIGQSHFPGWRFEAPDTVADASLHGFLFIGPPQPVHLLPGDLVSALADFSLTLSCNGEPVETRKGAQVLGNPLAAVAHLLEVLARQPDSPPLGAGELVSTGTVTTARPVRRGETWTTQVEGIPLPGLGIRFTA